MPYACLGLSKYQFITNWALQGTIHWRVRTLQFTQCSLLWKESHDWISKQKESHDMFLELLIKVTAGWQERHMVDLRCMTTVTAQHSFLSPTSEQEEKDFRKTSNLRSHLMRCFRLPRLPVPLLAFEPLVIQRWLNVIRAIGCLRSFFNALLRTQYICCANKYKISVPVGSVGWEWVICLAYERCIHFHPGLFISRLLAVCGFWDGTHHLSVPKQMCWRRPDWSARMGWAAEPC